MQDWIISDYVIAFVASETVRHIHPFFMISPGGGIQCESNKNHEITKSTKERVMSHNVQNEIKRIFVTFVFFVVKTTIRSSVQEDFNDY